jgi:N-acyl-D-aspartate/D-glutamate deacylase
MDADIAAFDPKTIQDKATFAEPYHQSVGMKYVMVGGKLVIDGGELVLGARSGKPIRRAVQQ